MTHVCLKLHSWHNERELSAFKHNDLMHGRNSLGNKWVLLWFVLNAEHVSPCLYHRESPECEKEQALHEYLERGMSSSKLFDERNCLGGTVDELSHGCMQEMYPWMEWNVMREPVQCL